MRQTMKALISRNWLAKIDLVPFGNQKNTFTQKLAQIIKDICREDKVFKYLPQASKIMTFHRTIVIIFIL